MLITAALPSCCTDRDCCPGQRQGSLGADVESDGNRGGHRKGTEAGERYLVIIFDKWLWLRTNVRI